MSSAPFGRAAKSEFGLDPELTFLNHGSFGAIPNALFERATETRRALERNPIQGIWRSAAPEVRRNAEGCARFVGADPSTTGFVANATSGINAVLRSLRFEPGDELLILDHGYNAVWQTMRFIAAQWGLVVRKVALALPVSGPQAVVDTLMAAIGERTRLIVLDQVTSPTALRLPVAEVIAAARARGVEVLVDGAHSPGMLDRPAAEAADAIAWTGNLHKWTCSLRGCALLSVRPDRAAEIHAPIISHFFGEGLCAELDWQGSIDPTPWLLALEALAYWDHFGGWERIRAHNHELATQMHAMLCERLGLEPLSPLDGSMLGSMATIRVPDSLQPGADGRTAEAFQAVLLDRFGVEIPVWDLEGVRYTRISCHVYNEAADYEVLADALAELR